MPRRWSLMGRLGLLGVYMSRLQRWRSTLSAEGSIEHGRRDSAEVAQAAGLAKHAAGALSLAGRALDPNAPGGPSLALGRLLLNEAFVAAARALCYDATLDTVELANEALTRQGKPESLTRRAQQRAQAVASLSRAALPDSAALARAQIEVAYLVEEATVSRRFIRAKRRALWTFALLGIAVVAVAIISAVTLRKPWEDYAWFASSTWPGFEQFGTLGQRGAYDLIFHTGEQVDPWVVVDLGALRTVEKVLVKNRTEYGSERGLPLVLELAGTNRQFVAVSTRTTTYDEWEVKFPPHKTRYLRLRAIGTTVLHLREIQIR